MPTDANKDVGRYLYDVFLSHHSSDKPQIEVIAARLEDEAGLKPFLDKWHLVPGEPWEEELEEALDRSATCAVFLGPSALGAWHNEEMRAALDERVRNKSFRVVPILLPGAEPKDKSTLPRFLRRLTWVDFRAGLDDPEAFHRLVAGIKGLPPGRQPSSLNSSAAPSRLLNQTSVAVDGKSTEKVKSSRKELWTKVVGAALALILSGSFIAAAIPRYKLEIKSPRSKKAGIYEAAAGTVTVKWAMSKEQWFREVEVGDVTANVTIKRVVSVGTQDVFSLGDEKEQHFQDSPGEVKATLTPGKYEVLIEAVEQQGSETIALNIFESDSMLETATLSGTVLDQNDRPIQGAKVTIDEAPGMVPVETSSDGVFTINALPKKHGEQVRIRVLKEGYLKNPYTEDIVIGAASPRVKLRRAE